MTPLALYRDGKLREAVTALGDELRSNPLDVKRREVAPEAVFWDVHGNWKRRGRKETSYNANTMLSQLLE
jgi:hypothetical protein